MTDQELEAVFRQTYSKMLKYATKLTRNRDVAADITQAAFTKIWKCRERLYPDKITSLIAETVFRIFLDHCRKEKVSQKRILLYIPPESIGPTQEDRILLGEINEIIKTMKPFYAEAFRALAIEGEGKGNFAKRKNINLGTVGSRYARARDIVMRRLNA